LLLTLLSLWSLVAVNSPQSFLTLQRTCCVKNPPKSCLIVISDARVFSETAIFYCLLVNQFDGELTEDEFQSVKVRLSHMMCSDLTQTEIVNLTHRCLAARRLSIINDALTAAQVLKQFPRFADTLTLVSSEINYHMQKCEQNRRSPKPFLKEKFDCGVC